MVLIFTAGNRHLFKVIFFKLKSAWILLILAAARGGGGSRRCAPCLFIAAWTCTGGTQCWRRVGCWPSGRTAAQAEEWRVFQHLFLLWPYKTHIWYSGLFLVVLVAALRLGGTGDALQLRRVSEQGLAGAGQVVQANLPRPVFACGQAVKPWLDSPLVAPLASLGGFGTVGLQAAPRSSGCWWCFMSQSLASLVLALELPLAFRLLFSHSDWPFSAQVLPHVRSQSFTVSSLQINGYCLIHLCSTTFEQPPWAACSGGRSPKDIPVGLASPVALSLICDMLCYPGFACLYVLTMVEHFWFVWPFLT